MVPVSEQRVRELERQTQQLDARLASIEARLSTGPSPAAAPAATAATPPAWPAPRSPRPRPAATAATAATVDAASATAGPRPRTIPPVRPQSPSPAPVAATRDFEDLLGGRVLAWTGGVAVLAGIAFLLAIAVSRGWIGPGARTVLAGAFSLALIAVGARLHETGDRTDAALAAVAAGLAGMFATVAVGATVYAVLPVRVALILALVTGAVATTLAVRWQARGIGALGIVGALLAPALAGAPSDGITLTVLWLAAASGAAVLVWQRWDWLGLAVFAIALPQWVWWLFDASPQTSAVLLVLTAFGVLNVTAAVGFELRVRTAGLRPASALLLTLNATALALAGWFALRTADSVATAQTWLGMLAAAHLAVGLATSATRINRDIRLLTLGLGTVLADLTAGLVLHGPLLAVVWAITSVGFGLLARHVLAGRAAGERGNDETLLAVGLGGHLLLTTLQALSQVPVDSLASEGSVSPGACAAIAATACAAFVAGRFVHAIRPAWRIALDVVALTAAGYLTAMTLDGPWLAAAFAAEAVALGAIAARERDVLAGGAAATYLGVSLMYTLCVLTPPQALVEGLTDIPGAALALGAIAAAALWGAWRLARVQPADGDDTAELLAQARTTLAAAGAITLLYLASTALVTPFQPGDGPAAAGALDGGTRQLGQLLLSGLWAATGLAALVTGLRRDDRALRLGSLALLLVTVGKVFLYDLAALTSLYRVGSFIALGLLLLVAAGVWQRMRPHPLPERCDAPPAAG